MTAVSDIFNAFAPEYLERYPTLPTWHQKTISAIQNCRSGYYAHGSPIFKAVQKNRCKALYRALKKSPKTPESAAGEG